MQPIEISLDTPIGGCPQIILVETETGRGVLKREQLRNGRVDLSSHSEDWRPQKLKEVPFGRTLREVAASITESRALRAFTFEGYTLRNRTNVRTWAAFIAMGIPFVLAALGATTGFADESIWALPLTIVAVFLFMFIGDWTQKSAHWNHPALAPAQSKESVEIQAIELPPLVEEADIDDVKAEYGRLLSDIVYRIENPALFDPHEPASKAFTLALLQWDNNDGLLPPEQMHALAATVRSTFAAAKANAERLGMDYLPADTRERANTALKAARLATDEAATEAERANALARAVRILDELALYYLPSGAQTRKAITGNAPLQLPGRKTS